MLHNLTEGQFIVLVFSAVILTIAVIVARSILRVYFYKEPPLTIDEQIQKVRTAIWPYDQYLTDEEIIVRLRRHVTWEAAAHEMRFNIGRNGRP